MPQPVEIDVERIPWNIPLRLANSLQGIVSINMIHLAQWSSTLALLRVRKITQQGKIFDFVRAI